MSESIKRRGFMLVLSSPSGAGKTAIAHRILETEDNMSLSVSVTTRSARPGEVNGKDYFFVDRPTFDGMVQRDEFWNMPNFAAIVTARRANPSAKLWKKAKIFCSILNGRERSR